MACTSTVVENPGPPSVIIFTWSKILKELIVASVMQKNKLERSMGTVILKMSGPRLLRPQPLTRTLPEKAPAYLQAK